MSNTYDLILTPSKEAEICLTCEAKRCKQGNCQRFKQMNKELQQEKKLHRNEKK